MGAVEIDFERTFCVLVKDPSELLTLDRYEKTNDAIEGARRFLGAYPEQRRIFIYSVILVGQISLEEEADPA